MRTIVVLFLIVGMANSALQDLKNDIKGGRKQIRGVNLGGWLVLERWMTGGSPIWEGVDDGIANGGEYVTMKHLGHDRGDPRMEQHRSRYITEQDFRDMSAAGVNTVRIPVGYWIVGFDNSGGGDPDGWKVYAPGGLTYLDRAIREWGPRNNILVLISFHAAKGSQNGNDNSSPQVPGTTYWSKYPENVKNTLDSVQFLVNRYKNDLSFIGLTLINEPSNQDEGVLKQYYYDAFGRIRNDEGSDCLLSISPMLSQQGPWDSDWRNFMRPPNFQNIRHEWHPYQVWGFTAGNGWTQEKVINYCNNDLKGKIESWQGNWLLIGEWSMATDGSLPMNDDQMRRYAQAQLNAFSKAVGGWTFWTWKFYDDGDYKNGWSLKSMIKHGFIRIP